MKLGVIGGSGLYEMPGLSEVEPVSIRTPFGEPSDAYHRGRLGDTELVFLSRHGRGHRQMPSEINHRANIFGFKTLGIERVVAISAVGSLQESIRPRDVVLPDQYFDRTKTSADHTFFGDGLVAHVAFAEPVCRRLRAVLFAAEKEIATEQPFTGLRVHDGGTYVNMEGPAFSTKAESRTYRKLGFDVIGMTSLPEAKLCREAEICYAVLAMATDYDCWHESEEAVTVAMVIENLRSNAGFAHGMIRRLAAQDLAGDCTCRHALANAIITAPEAVPAEAKRKLAPIVGKYLV